MPSQPSSSSSSMARKPSSETLKNTSIGSSSSESQRRKKNLLLVRIKDQAILQDQTSELSTLIKSVIQEHENLPQNELRTLEHQFSKILTSYSKHLKSNVRVMKPMERQLAGKISSL